jgi:predicted 2-oxoglutarate/Fe(II)-dependent dioxygenase YbiX
MDLTKVVNNFIEEADCQTIISHLEKLILTGDVIVRDDGRVGVINRQDEVFDLLVEKYKNKTIEMFNDKFKYFSGYIATKYVPGVGMSTHIDSKVGEEMGALMYLNDDYEGGELTYKDPEGNVKTIKPRTGDMVYCPSWYPHGVNKVTKGDRYFFTVSFLSHPV